MFAKKKKKKGFTLIELLVVIAIIGILAGIVLVSLSGARNKAKIARVQADIGQIRTIAETLYDGAIYPAAFLTVTWTGGTAPACTGAGGGTDPGLISLDNDIRAQNGIGCATAGGGVVIQKQTGVGANTTYRAFVLLPGGSLTASSAWWCVDNAGNSRQTTCTGVAGNCAAPAADTAAVCP